MSDLRQKSHLYCHSEGNEESLRLSQRFFVASLLRMTVLRQGGCVTPWALDTNLESRQVVSG